MQTYLIKNAATVNEGKIKSQDLLIKKGRIERIDPEISYKAAATELHGEGYHLLPGMIDDQVHFREPGLTGKGDLASESAAAAAGGITSFMDMPNTVPPALTRELLEEKFALAGKKSLINYSFYMGTSNDNVEEALALEPGDACGIKIFLGSSTGNLLVNRLETIETLFARSRMLIAVHCEDEKIIAQNLETAIDAFPKGIPPSEHPVIRSVEACYKSSSSAVALAKKHNTRLHVLHISTAKELALFESGNNVAGKKITAEVCLPHLTFNLRDYETLGNRIKWNPAVKSQADQDALFEALTSGRIDVIGTDHAPHLEAEKDRAYLLCPSGGPFVQHALIALFERHLEKKISLEMIAHRTAHQVARCFGIADRGFLREGYFADLTLVDLNCGQKVIKSSLLYKCGWSPLEDHMFSSSILKTFINGTLVFDGSGIIGGEPSGQRLQFGAVHD